MILSTKGRYGLKMIFQLALSYEKGTMSLKDIANKLDLSDTYLEQLMSQLKKAGLVNSIRGAQGGYELSREPSLITVGEVIRPLEGSLAPSECVGGEETECSKADYCATRLIWEKIMVGIDNVIDGITLQDMINDYDKLNEKEKGDNKNG